MSQTESERAVVASVLLTGTEALSTALNAGLDFRHFYDERLRLTFKAAHNLALRDSAIDLITVRGELATVDPDGKVDAAFLSSLTDGVPGQLNVRAYAETVQADHWKRRRREAVANAHVAIDGGNGDFESAFQAILDTAVEERQIRKVSTRL